MSKVALVTGGNRGLGLGFIEVLADRLEPGSTIYMGVRDRARGEAAAQLLEAARCRVEPLQIDIASDASVAHAAQQVQARHGGIDILIGNAALTRASYGPADIYIETNNLGTHRLIRQFGPLLNAGARLLIVASCHGVLTGAPGRRKGRTAQDEAAIQAENRRKIAADPSLTIAPAIRDRLIGPAATLAEIETALTEFIALRAEDKAVAAGWPEWLNTTSKFAQIAATQIFARENAKDFRARDILVNVCCPGLVATDATADGFYGEMTDAFTAREAAENLAWIVTQPPRAMEPYGKMLFHHTEQAVF